MDESWIRLAFCPQVRAAHLHVMDATAEIEIRELFEKESRILKKGTCTIASASAKNKLVGLK